MKPAAITATPWLCASVAFGWNVTGSVVTGWLTGRFRVVVVGEMLVKNAVVRRLAVACRPASAPAIRRCVRPAARRVQDTSVWLNTFVRFIPLLYPEMLTVEPATFRAPGKMFW